MGTKAILTVGATTGPTGARRRVEVGKLDYFVPSLDDFGLPAPDRLDADGTALYDDLKLDWLQSAVTARVQGAVRNLVKVADDLSGFELVRAVPTSLDELMEGGSGGGRYFEVRKLCCEQFAGYVAGLAASAEGKQRLVDYFGNPAMIGAAAEKVKEAIAGHYAKFVSSLPDEQGTQYASYLRAVKTALESEAVEDEASFA